MKLIHKNKKAYFDYEILQEYKAGMMLLGPEVKSIRKGDVNLKGSYISFNKQIPVLKGANISRYKHDQSENYDPFRDRPLLLNANELHRIQTQLNTQGVTLVPLFIGLQGPYIKLQIALVRGKKKHDKRQSIKEREGKREVSRLVKQLY